MTTGEADNRVVPAHSFKYLAALQSSDLGSRPRLLRIGARAGHGAGKPTTKVIEARLAIPNNAANTLMARMRSKQTLIVVARRRL